MFLFVFLFAFSISFVIQTLTPITTEEKPIGKEPNETPADQLLTQRFEASIKHPSPQNPSPLEQSPLMKHKSASPEQPSNAGSRDEDEFVVVPASGSGTYSPHTNSNNVTHNPRKQLTERSSSRGQINPSLSTYAGVNPTANTSTVINSNPSHSGTGVAQVSFTMAQLSVSPQSGGQGSPNNNTNATRNPSIDGYLSQVFIPSLHSPHPHPHPPIFLTYLSQNNLSSLSSAVTTGIDISLKSKLLKHSTLWVREHYWWPNSETSSFPSINETMR